MSKLGMQSLSNNGNLLIKSKTQEMADMAKPRLAAQAESGQGVRQETQEEEAVPCPMVQPVTTGVKQPKDQLITVCPGSTLTAAGSTDTAHLTSMWTRSSSSSAPLSDLETATAGVQLDSAKTPDELSGKSANQMRNTTHLTSFAAQGQGVWNAE